MHKKENKITQNNTKKNQHYLKNTVLQQSAIKLNNLNNETILQLQGIIGNQKIGQLIKSQYQIEKIKKAENTSYSFEKENRTITYPIGQKKSIRQRNLGFLNKHSKVILQRKLIFNDDTAYLDPTQNSDITNSVYIDIMTEADSIKRKIYLKIDGNMKDTAKYRPQPYDPEGTIWISPRNMVHEKNESNAAFNNRLAQVGHETRHALDDLRKVVRGFRTDNVKLMHSEFRAFATEAAISLHASNKDKPINPGQSLLIACFKDKEAFVNPKGTVFTRVKKYLHKYDICKNPTDDYTKKFLKQQDAAIINALNLFKTMAPSTVFIPQWLAKCTTNPIIKYGGITVLIVFLAFLFKHFFL